MKTKRILRANGKALKSSSGCKCFSTFKKKYDQNIPRRGTPAFEQYIKEAEAAEIALKKFHGDLIYQ